MDKKYKNKSVAPLPILGKSSKKGKKTTDKEVGQHLNQLINDSPLQKQVEQKDSSEEPHLTRLKKNRKLQNNKQKERVVQLDNRNQESQFSVDGQVEEQSQVQQYQRFQNLDDEDLKKLEAQKNNKKGRGKSKIKQGEQELGKYIENHFGGKKQSKKGKAAQMEKQKQKKPMVQKTLFTMFQNSSQPRRQQQFRMDQQRVESSDNEDSLQIARKRNMMMQSLNAGLGDDEALKIAIKQSKQSAKKNQDNQIPYKIVQIKQQNDRDNEQTPIDNYSFKHENKNKMVNSRSFDAMKNSSKVLQQKAKKANQQDLKQRKVDGKQKKVNKKQQKSKSKNKGKHSDKSQTQEATGLLSGLGIVITGQIEPYSKNQVLEMLLELGATTPTNITKKTTHLLQGSCVKNQYGKITGQDVKTTSKSVEAAQKNIKIIAYEQIDNFFIQKTGRSLKQLIQKDKPKKQGNTLQKYVDINKNGSSAKTNFQSQMQDQNPEVKPVMNDAGKKNVPWTEKYCPKSSQMIIGQPSQIKNLKQWLSIWQDVHIRGNKRDIKSNFNSFLPSGNINSNAALLSGDAGIGKTTSARLVAAQFGYSIVEFNASDARNKKSVQLIKNGSNNLTFMNNKAKQMAKTLIIMDEIDGMSSGDRGGITAIIDMIKKTKVPIICICNDRQSTKIRSLAGHCFDIKFHKPDKRRIAEKMKEIIELQGGKANQIAMQALVQLLQNDMRQIINYIEVLFRSGVRNFTADMIERRCSNVKDSSLTLNFFEVTKTLLSRTMFNSLNIHERTELAFIDSDMVPLMVHQNYLSACPKKKLNSKQFHKFVKATEGFVNSDQLDKTIMRNQNYFLMPNKMFLSCVYPCQMICENLGFPKFSQWLGKFSSQRKNRRLLKELKFILGTVALVSSYSAKYNYSTLLYERICRQLSVADPDAQVIVKFMLHYGITPSTLTESLSALQYGNRQSLYKNIETGKKTKLTKLYNKMVDTVKFKKQKTKQKGVEHLKFDPVLGEMEQQINEEQQQGQLGQQGQSSVSDLIVDKKAKSKPKKKK